MLLRIASNPQFNRFRGLVYFESDDPGMLPWNTTKTGVNQDSDVYSKARQRMISMTRPVINFLNDVATQRRELETDEKPQLEQKVEQARLTDIMDVSASENRPFKGPEADEEEEEDEEPEMKTIRYRAPKAKLERAKKELGVSTYKGVGEETFEYFWDMEGLEE